MFLVRWESNGFEKTSVGDDGEVIDREDSKTTIDHHAGFTRTVFGDTVEITDATIVPYIDDSNRKDPSFALDSCDYKRVA